MQGGISNIIVLMLENRSFDHMFGFLTHPSPQFDRLQGTEENPTSYGDPPVTVSETARRTLPLDPAHHHADVMMQLTNTVDARPPYAVNNQGFVVNFEEAGLKEKKKKGFGPHIMRCQPEENLPVLSFLAKEFAVCTRWFSSVPGATWPNRNFCHAATSDGEYDIVKRFYKNPTIYELLSDNKRDWTIYHQGIAQVMAFRRIWIEGTKARFQDLDWLFWAIKKDKLPHYSFVEPDHFWPWSGSQHPSNNKKKDGDFKRAERLIRKIYETLRANPRVFNKTAFLITYDEHGGFFDKQPPPFDARYRDGKVGPDGFRFDLLGVRVPTVIVSPLIPRATVDATTYDHASVPATIRRLFAPDAQPLTPRDANANTFEHLFSLDAPRDTPPIPETEAIVEQPTTLQEAMAEAAEAPEEHELDEFQHSMLWLADRVSMETRQSEAFETATFEGFMEQLEVAIDFEAGPSSAAPAALRQHFFGEYFRRSLPRALVLRTADDLMIESPSDAEIATALADLRASAGGEVTLSWPPGKALTIRTTREAELAVESGASAIGRADPELWPDLMALFRSRQYDAIETRLR